MPISTFFFRLNTIMVAAIFFSATCGLFPCQADARQAQGRTRTSVHHGGQKHNKSNINRNKNNNRNTNINRNQNVNVNKNVNVNVRGGGGYYGGYHHNVGAAVAVGAVTGLVVGSVIAAASMPPSCTTVVSQGITYRQCGSTWYQPQYAGSQVNYIVVNPPY